MGITVSIVILLLSQKPTKKAVEQSGWAQNAAVHLTYQVAVVSTQEPGCAKSDAVSLAMK